MKWLIDTDSPFYNIMNFFADVIIFALVFFLCSLPIFTIGAANCAMYYCAQKRIFEEKASLRDFFDAFRKNFIIATLIWIWILIIFFALLIIWINFSQVYVLVPILIFLLLELIFTCIYIFPIINRNCKSIKLSLIIAHKHLPTTLLCTIIAVIIMITCAFYPLLILISGGLYNFLTAYFIEKIFRNYKI